MSFLLTHELILGKNSSPIGVRLFINEHTAVNEDVFKFIQSLNDQWIFGDKVVFLSFNRVPEDLLDWEFPPHIVIEVPVSSIFDEKGLNFINTLIAARVSVCLNFDYDFETSQALELGIKPRFLGFDSLKFNPAKIQLLTRKVYSLGIPVITGVDTISEYKTYSASGVGGVSGWFFIKNLELPNKAINSTQMNIVKVLNLVRNNAEVREIESALKQDVALSYKLLRYLNSASMGISQEIQSFKHAVNILGYDKLNRWLSLLLVTASKDAMAPALMYTSLVRGRFMELLGKIKSHKADDLFITGVFSLLDVILGVKMEQALDAMLLPESICSALLGLDSDYLEYLHLVKACESNNDKEVLKYMTSLGLSVEDINSAFLKAHEFAAQMQF